MPTGRHHPRLSPFSFPHDFKTSPRFRSERNHSTLKIHPRLPPFSLCTILKSPPVPTLKIPQLLGRQRIEPSVRKIVLFLNLRTHRAVSFSSAFSDEYTTANLSACDRDRQRPFLNVKQNLPYFKKVAHCSTPSVKTRG